MAACELSFEFDKDSTHYAVGDTVSGRVLLKALSDFQCQSLLLQLFWHSNCLIDRENALRLNLFNGVIKAGQKLAFPFQFNVPAGPLSYNGKLLFVNWKLSVEADIPWSLNVSAITDLAFYSKDGDDTVISIGDNEELLNLARYIGNKASAIKNFEFKEPERVDVKSQLWLYGPNVALGLIAFIVLFSFIPMREGLRFTVVGLLVTLGPILALIVLSHYAEAMKSAWLQWRYGPFQLTLPSDPLIAPGKDCVMELSFCPKKDMKVRRVWAVLSGQEKVFERRGKQNYWNVHQPFREVVHFCEEEVFQEGQERHFKQSHTLAPHAPISFAGEECRLDWSLTVHIDLANGMDWAMTKPLVVYPSAVVEALGKKQEPKIKAKAKPKAMKLASVPSLGAALQQLKTAVQSGDRGRIRAALGAKIQSFDLKVEHVKPTPEASALPGCSGGQTVVGRAVGFQSASIAVQYDPSLNDETSQLQEGDGLLVEARLKAWDGQESRAILLGRV